MSFSNPIPSSSRPNRAVRSVLALAAAAAVVGCDDAGKSDKTTMTSVDSAMTQLSGVASLAPGEGVEKVSGSLADAASKASPGAFKAIAAAAAAAVDQQAAFAGVIKLKDQEAAVRRTLTELRRLGDQVVTTDAYATGYLKGDPKESVADLSQHISTIQGNAQAAKTGSTKAQNELDQKQQDLAAQQKKRGEMLSTAEVQLNHANGLKGEEAVRAFADASETRRAADDLAITIDLLKVQVDRLKQDVAASQAQEQILETGIDNLKGQGKLLESGWVKTQEAAAGQKKVVTAAVAGDEKTPMSVDSTAQKLNKQLADLTAARSLVLGQLNEAKKFAGDAVQEATAFAGSLSAKASLPGKEGESYRALRTAVSPTQYQYLSGVVQNDLGMLALSQASLYQDVKQTVEGVRKAIEGSGTTVPESLSKVDLTPLEQLFKDAEDNLKDGASALTNVESGDAPAALKDSAKRSRLIGLFANLNLLDLRKASGDTSAEAAATQVMSDAQALKAELVASNVSLPGLPGELGDASSGATNTTPRSTTPETPPVEGSSTTLPSATTAPAATQPTTGPAASIPDLDPTEVMGRFVGAEACPVGTFEIELKPDNTGTFKLTPTAAGAGAASPTDYPLTWKPDGNTLSARLAPAADGKKVPIEIEFLDIGLNSQKRFVVMGPGWIIAGDRPTN